MRPKQAFITGVAILAAVTMTSAVPGGGTVSGKVTYEGTPAKQKPIDMSKEPSCAKQYATPPPTETVVTGPNNALENVVVYISAGAPDEPPPSQAALLAQKGCPDLPPGKYTVTAFHESYGDQTQEVSIAGSETKNVNFVFKAKPY